ncbi:MAG: DMT family transporter [Proteobacteria bacterium]|nr:DMT family transporter [Pseudomonadota bacterium]
MAQVLIGAVIISSSAVFVKLVDVGPTAAMFYRFLFGAIALLCTVLLKKEALWKNIHTVKWALLGGFIFAIDLFLWHRSIHYVGPGLATILANFQVFFLAMIGALFLNEKLTMRYVVSVPLAFLGLFMIIGWHFDKMEMLYKRGIIYGLLTAITYTALTLVMRKSQKISEKLSPSAHMMWVCFFGAALGSLFVLPSGETFHIPDLTSFVFLAAYGVICTGVGWVFISKGLPKVSASVAGLALILQPTGSFLWDVLLFSRPTTWFQSTGAVLAICAIYLGTVKKN